MLANVLFPNWLITMLLLGLLIFLTYKTARKAWSLHRSEVRYLAQQDDQRQRPAVPKKRVPARSVPALDVRESNGGVSTETPSPATGSAATAAVVDGQGGNHVESSHTGAGQGGHSISERGKHPAPSRQVASLEVEGLPTDSLPGAHVQGFGCRGCRDCPGGTHDCACISPVKVPLQMRKSSGAVLSAEKY